MAAETPEVSAPAPRRIIQTALTNGQRRLVMLLAIIFASLPFFFIGDFEFQGMHLSDLDATGFFFSLGLLPGAIGIVYQIVTANARRAERHEELQQYYAFRNARAEARQQERMVVAVDEVSTDPLGAVAACLFLTGIFLLIAVFAGFEASEQRGSAANGVQGMMYAGLGSYVAVLYYMVARLYANALSPRFLLTSALRTASAVAIGWVFGIVGVTAIAGVPSTTEVVSTSALSSNAVIFLVGLFHNMAINGLRKRASKLFGSEAMDANELTLTAIEGVDDTTAELLAEHGVSTVQHLATVEPGELCDRTLLPLERILDWVNQALLVQYLKRNIAASRALGVRSATDLAIISINDDTALLATLAEKTGVPAEAIDYIARQLRDNYLVALIYELQEGKDFPITQTAPPPTTVVAPTISIKQETAPSPLPAQA